MTFFLKVFSMERVDSREVGGSTLSASPVRDGTRMKRLRKRQFSDVTDSVCVDGRHDNGRDEAGRNGGQLGEVSERHFDEARKVQYSIVGL
jgi:hypothetical protein